MKTAIIIMGNIASGKTSVCQHLSEKLKIPYFNVDMYVRPTLEAFKADFLQAICHREHQIVELIPGYFGNLVMSHLVANGYFLHKFYLSCSPAVCLKRFANRQNNRVFPKSVEQRVGEIAQLQHIYKQAVDRTHIYDAEHYTAPQIAEMIGFQI